VAPLKAQQLLAMLKEREAVFAEVEAWDGDAALGEELLGEGREVPRVHAIVPQLHALHILHLGHFLVLLQRRFVHPLVLIVVHIRHHRGGLGRLEDLAVFGAGRLSPLLAKHSGVIALFRALHVLGFVGRRPFVRAVLRFFGLVERSGHRGDLHNAVRADPLVHTPIEVVIVDVVTPVALSALLFLHYRAEALGLVHPSDGEHASGRIRMLVWVSLDHWRRRSLFLRRCTGGATTRARLLAALAPHLAPV